MYQKLMLLGRLGKDIEMNGSGNSLRGNFSVATDRSKKEKDGSWSKETQWFNCTVWGKRAENLAPHMLKGTTLFVEGEIREYQKKDGGMGWGVDVKDIQLAGKGGRPDRKQSGDSGQQAYSETSQDHSAVAKYSPPTSENIDEIPF